MSIIDSISETAHETIAIAVSSHDELRKQYEKLSNAFWSHPTMEMVYALDKLLEVIKEVADWQRVMRESIDDMDGE